MDQTTGGFNLGNAIQDVLSRGLDAATAYYQTRLLVNDPTPSVVGPNGQRVPVGTVANSPAAVLAAVPSWVWIAGVGVLLVAVVVPALRR